MQGCSYILLDYDHCTKVDNYAIRQRVIACGLPIVHLVKLKSPSKHGWHVVIYVKGVISNAEKVAIGAICESDMNRVIHDFRRALSLRLSPDNFPHSVLFR